MCCTVQAINAFFRGHFESGGAASGLVVHTDPCGTCSTVHPQHAQSQHNADPLLLSLEPELVLKVVSWLDPIQVTRMSGTCRIIRELASDNAVWRPLCALEWSVPEQTLQERFGPLTAGTVHIWQAGFCHISQEHKRDRKCPRCRVGGSIVPVVYGFPAKYLMDAASREQVVMGWDYKHEADHNWACIRCNTQWSFFPWTPRVCLELLTNWWDNQCKLSNTLCE